MTWRQVERLDRWLDCGACVWILGWLALMSIWGIPLLTRVCIMAGWLVVLYPLYRAHRWCKRRLKGEG